MAESTVAADNTQSAVLELYLAEMRQLFNSMDPAPFRERDLDPKAEAYVVDWAREQASKRPLALIVHLGQERAGENSEAMLRGALHEYFRGRAVATRTQLRQLLRTGRISLVIGLAFLGLAIVMGEALASLFSNEGYATLARESLVIGGWVALWRPAEIFLHDWWPILGEARLFDRLAAMPVMLRGAGTEAEQSA